MPKIDRVFLTEWQWLEGLGKRRNGLRSERLRYFSRRDVAGYRTRLTRCESSCDSELVVWRMILSVAASHPVKYSGPSDRIRFSFIPGPIGPG